MTDMQRPQELSYGEKAELVRMFTAEKLRAYLEALEPYALGLAGSLEPDARLGPLYLKTFQQLGDLYRVRDVPVEGGDRISIAEHEAKVEEAKAVEAERVRMELEEEHRRALEGRRVSDFARAKEEVVVRMREFKEKRREF